MPLMFNRDDVAKRTRVLSRLLCLIFYRLGVTMDDYVRMWKEYGKREKMPIKDLNWNRNNHRKVITLPDRNVTFETFFKTMVEILQLQVMSFSITFVHPKTKKPVTISNNDPIDPPPEKTTSEKTVFIHLTKDGNWIDNIVVPDGVDVYLIKQRADGSWPSKEEAVKWEGD